MAYPYGVTTTAATSKPLVATYDATISSSTAITLNAATTGIEVTAIDKPILLKWDATASTSAFDAIIAPNTTKVFSVPRGTTTANFIEQSATAILVCVEF
jgi:hypothetical protein